MTTTAIATNTSSPTLQVEPGGPPAEFEVTVTNGSDRFASFQVELIAAGHNGDGPNTWYKLSPTASSKKPPGAVTTFHIAILDTPIPGFVGFINVNVRVFSVELSEERRNTLGLTICPTRGATSLQLELPRQQFQTYPGQPLEIPVRVYNPGQHLSQALVRDVHLDAQWLPESAEQHLQIPPGQRVETTLVYQAPFGAAAPSQTYNLVIEASHNHGPPSQVSGIIEVLPMGFVDCESQPKRQQIPPRRQWKFWRSPPVTYSLILNNASNVPQEATLELDSEQQPPCDLRLVPETLVLDPEEQGFFELIARKRRPWLGRPRQLVLELTCLWSNEQVEIRNRQQTLELEVKPILPLGVQLGAALVALYLLWWLSWLNLKNPFFGHSEPVNSLQFNGIGERVISGSNDQTLIEWTVGGFFNPLSNQQRRQFPKPRGRIWRSLLRPFQQREPCSFAGCPTGTKAVRVVRFRPVDNNWLAAGLENGEVQLWDLLAQDSQPFASFTYEPDDRVFALEFSQNARSLFSGHGSGRLLHWDLSQLERGGSADGLQPHQVQDFDFAISALAAIGSDETGLAVAGRFNQFHLWTPQDETQITIPYHSGSQNDYITSLDLAQFNRDYLASADNQGYISLWDLRRCLESNGDCQPLDQWQDGHEGLPVRSVALSDNGCYLVSGGDDGRVVLWSLGADGRRRDSQGQPLIEVQDKSFYSVDIKQVNQRLLVAAGGNDRQEVWVHSQRLANSSCDRP